jgi:hypothetical protein
MHAENQHTYMFWYTFMINCEGFASLDDILGGENIYFDDKPIYQQFYH